MLQKNEIKHEIELSDWLKQGKTSRGLYRSRRKRFVDDISVNRSEALLTPDLQLMQLVFAEPFNGLFQFFLEKQTIETNFRQDSFSEL